MLEPNVKTPHFFILRQQKQTDAHDVKKIRILKGYQVATKKLSENQITTNNFEKKRDIERKYQKCALSVDFPKRFQGKRFNSQCNHLKVPIVSLGQNPTRPSSVVSQIKTLLT